MRVEFRMKLHERVDVMSRCKLKLEHKSAARMPTTGFCDCRRHLTFFLCSLTFMLPMSGCSGISIAPSCPNEMPIGGTASIVGNVLNPGAVPVYTWTVDPANAGTFASTTMSDTTFTASAAGMATITLTASDGLFQVASWCQVQILSTGLPVVQLTSSPPSPSVGTRITLTCTAAAQSQVAYYVVEALPGPNKITVTSDSPGVSTATPTLAGDYTFQCIGTQADGIQSSPVTINVTVAASSKPGGGRGSE